jgi:hypothetical protein
VSTRQKNAANAIITLEVTRLEEYDVITGPQSGARPGTSTVQDPVKEGTVRDTHTMCVYMLLYGVHKLVL